MTYVVAATYETATKLAGLILAGKLPPMAADLDSALALLELHPRPLAYGLAIWVAKTAPGRPSPVSVDLVRGTELSLLTAKARRAA